MARLEPSHAVLLLGALLLADGAWASQTSEYQCRREGMMRRVQLGGGPAGEPLPCEVVYWKDSEQPYRGQVLWTAATDQQYCEDQASAFVEQLRDWGWRCERSGAEMTETPGRATAVAWPRIKPAPAAGAPSRRAIGPAAPAALAGAIDGTLASLGHLHPGVFESRIADYGDLDGDGSEDAVVIITYRADGGETVDYLVAYLFDGAGYRSAAARTLGGSVDGAYEGEVEQIVDGAILVKLRPGTEPTASSRPTAFVLQEGRLIERE
jgi:hypothetical protein